MKKRYKAKTNVSINVVLASGANRHITFSPLTGGGSVFYTDDPEIEKAMESHYKFGKLFYIDRTYMPAKPCGSPTKNPIAPAPVIEETSVPTADETTDTPTMVAEVVPETVVSETGNNEPESDEHEVGAVETEAEYKTILVSDPDAAKAYLAEHFGISRTKLKKIENIKKAAAENGIFFQGI